MAERALRGTRLGAVSYENDRNADLAPRQVVAFSCANDHTSRAVRRGGRAPGTWECRSGGAWHVGSTASCRGKKAVKPPRTHWDMLLERRTVEDLEEVLNERLAILRAQRRKSA